MTNEFNKTNPPAERLHNKRVGRELAMQYLFQCSITQEGFSVAKWEAFLEQAGAELNLSSNRYGRRCREYAEKLIEVCIKDAERIENTIKDIARMAGVSTTAVSFVLNNRPGVSEATREKVQAIIRSTGFTLTSAKQQ